MRPHVQAVAVGLTIFGVVSNAVASQPDQEPNAPPGMPGSGFVPEAGYLRTLQALALERHLAASGLGFPGAPSLVNPISGTRLVPVLCVQFPGRPGLFTTAQHRDALFDPPGPRPNPPRPNFTQYYRDISQGRFTPNGEVFGWFTMPKSDTYYEGGNNGRNQRIGELLDSALTQADAGVDFGRFDNDGPDGQPNSGDDDGLVDTLFLIHPEIGGEIGGGVNGNIWSHQWQYSNYAAHNGRAFVTNDPRLGKDGLQALNDDGSPAFIQVDDYTIQPGLSADSTPAQPRIIEIGVFCHEYGHALGLPDLYDRPNTPPNSSGIGHYCLMAGGSYGADDDSPETPVHMSAWCKAALGWADLMPITANGTINLEPVQQGNLIFNFDVPGTNGREFFLVEFRDPAWTFDPATQINWDADFAPGGVAVWHVDENVGSASNDWPFAPPGQGQNDHPSRPGNPLPSFVNPHALVALMQADGQLHLERNMGRGDSSDLLGTGEEFGDDPTCRFGSRGYGAQATGFSLRGIQLADRLALASIDDLPPGAGPNALAAAAPGPGTASDGEVPDASESLFLRRLQPDASRRIRDLQPLSRKLAVEGPQSLSDEDRKRIAGATAAELSLGFSATERRQAQKIAAAQRTAVVNEQSEAETPAWQAARTLVEQSESDEALIRFAATEGIEKLTRLAVPIRGAGPAEDAAYRVEQDDAVRTLIGSDVSLRASDPQQIPEGGSGTIRYAQLVELDGTQIPLSCHGVTFRYRDGKLTEIESEVLPTEGLHISGAPDALREDEARKLFAEQTGLPEDRILQADRCVYLLNNQPDQARTAVRLKVDSGGKRPPIEVFLDQETRKVLKID